MDKELIWHVIKWEGEAPGFEEIATKLKINVSDFSISDGIKLVNKETNEYLIKVDKNALDQDDLDESGPYSKLLIC